MSCRRCGERFRRGADEAAHICVPNNTGVNPGDSVRVGDATGQVLRVSRAMAQVYFRGSLTSAWYSADEIERVAS